MVLPFMKCPKSVLSHKTEADPPRTFPGKGHLYREVAEVGAESKELLKLVNELK